MGEERRFLDNYREMTAVEAPRDMQQDTPTHQLYACPVTTATITLAAPPTLFTWSEVKKIQAYCRKKKEWLALS